MPKKLISLLLSFLLYGVSISFTDASYHDPVLSSDPTVPGDLNSACPVWPEVQNAITTGDVNTFQQYLGTGFDLSAPIGMNREPISTILFRIGHLLSANNPQLFRSIMDLILHAETFNPNIHSKDQDTILHLALKVRCKSLINALIDLSPMDVNARDKAGNTPLFLLVNKVCAFPKSFVCSVTEKLVNHNEFDFGAVNNQGKSVDDLIKSTIETLTEISKIMRAAEERRPAPSKEAQFFTTLIEGDWEKIKIFINSNPDMDPNWQDPGSGRTFLMGAIATGDVEIIREFLDKFPHQDPTLKDKEGKTASDYARNNCDEIVNDLIKIHKPTAPETN
jgi:ankyrin repeat protein